MDDLIAFLRARLDDDRHAAADMRERESWMADCGESHDSRIELRGGWTFTPDRLLAEVDAKRRTIDAYVEWRATVAADGDDYARGVVAGLGVSVRLEALPFAGHPDYLQRWKP